VIKNGFLQGLKPSSRCYVGAEAPPPKEKREAGARPVRSFAVLTAHFGKGTLRGVVPTARCTRKGALWAADGHRAPFPPGGGAPI
jgi:hypothetical protein